MTRATFGFGFRAKQSVGRLNEKKGLTQDSFGQDDRQNSAEEREQNENCHNGDQDGFSLLERVVAKLPAVMVKTFAPRGEVRRSSPRGHVHRSLITFTPLSRRTKKTADWALSLLGMFVRKKKTEMSSGRRSAKNAGAYRRRA